MEIYKSKNIIVKMLHMKHNDVLEFDNKQEVLIIIIQGFVSINDGKNNIGIMEKFQTTKQYKIRCISNETYFFQIIIGINNDIEKNTLIKYPQFTDNYDIINYSDNHGDIYSNYLILLQGCVRVKDLYLSIGSIINEIIDLPIKFPNDTKILKIELPHHIDDRKVIYNNEHLAMIVNNLKEQRIILTSGCFDILHSGHINFLKEAKLLGNKLFVCLSSDNEIKKYKTPNRPINNLNDRLNVLKGISYIDYIILFDEIDIVNETSLDDIIRIVKPFYWVKGSDYDESEIYKKHTNISVNIIKNIPNISSSHIINKILNTYNNNSFDLKKSFLLIDLDGTLINTEKLHFNCYNKLLNMTLEEYDNKNQLNDIICNDDIKNNKNKLFIDIINNNEYELKLLEGVEDFINYIIKFNINCCIVTNTNKNNIELIKQKLPLLNSFNNWITNEDYKLKKPNNEPYKTAINKYYKNENYIIGIENTYAGYLSLKSLVTNIFIKNNDSFTNYINNNNIKLDNNITYINNFNEIINK